MIMKHTSPFQDGGRHHIETSPLICPANQWTGFYMITAFVLKGLISILNQQVIKVLVKHTCLCDKVILSLLKKMPRGAAKQKNTENHST